ncbi:hypothetical protein [Pseudomonas sp. NPDC007930]|uniref:hypothetical protein n=1 Tax=Pseudomonas sp. NPDC007930 TaxID=3364417 RepID=UPI0036E9A453
MKQLLEDLRVPFSFEEAADELKHPADEVIDLLTWAHIEPLVEIPLDMEPKLFYDNLNMSFRLRSLTQKQSDATYVIIDKETLKSIASGGKITITKFKSIKLHDRTSLTKNNLHTKVSRSLLKTYRLQLTAPYPSYDPKPPLQKIINFYETFKSDSQRMWISLDTKPIEPIHKLTLPSRTLPLESRGYELNTPPPPYNFYLDFMLDHTQPTREGHPKNLKISRHDICFYSSDIYSIKAFLKGIEDERKTLKPESRLDIVNGVARIFENKILSIHNSEKKWKDHEHGQEIFNYLKSKLKLEDSSIDAAMKVIISHATVFDDGEPEIVTPLEGNPTYMLEALARVNHAKKIAPLIPRREEHNMSEHRAEILSKCGIKPGIANGIRSLLV